MELFQLRYFLAAARQLNFTRAAEDAHISQPSLSQQIANLEREVGAKLFERKGRTVRLTDAGEVLREHAERMLTLEEDARRAVRAVMGLERGRLTVATLPTPGTHLLPSVLATFRAAHPSIDIRVRETVPARAVADMVTSSAADLGIVHLPCPVAGLETRELLTEELALVVPEHHPRVGTKPALADLAGENWIWPPDGQTPEHPLWAACLTAGFTPRVSCVSGSAPGMQALAAAGLGIALLPRSAIHPPDGATVVELAAPRPTRTLAVAQRDGGTLSHAASAFLSLLTNAPPD